MKNQWQTCSAGSSAPSEAMNLCQELQRLSIWRISSKESDVCMILYMSLSKRSQLFSMTRLWRSEARHRIPQSGSAPGSDAGQ